MDEQSQQSEEYKPQWLPMIPFKLVLSYLSLEDSLKYRAVSKDWRITIDTFYRVRSLCFSNHPSGFILGNGRGACGVLAQNFIRSPRFEQFVNTIGSPILSNLKHLRICELTIQEGTVTAFAQAINSFGQLEELDLIRINPLIRINHDNDDHPAVGFELKLPKLQSIQLEESRVHTLKLVAPLLKNVYLCAFPPRSLELVHESVERLFTDMRPESSINRLGNLKILYTSYGFRFNPNLLARMEKLVEIHLTDRAGVMNFFEQKQRYGRADLKIYLNGYLLDDPLNDPLMTMNLFAYLAQDPARLDQMHGEIPYARHLPYECIEMLAPGLDIEILKRFPNLTQLIVETPIGNLPRFLIVLKNFPNIVTLQFSCNQLPELFHFLPEYCTVRYLTISYRVKDLSFLFAFRHLIKLDIPYPHVPTIAPFVEKVFKELHFLQEFSFSCEDNQVECIRSIESGHTNQFQVLVKGQSFFLNTRMQTFTDINAAIQFCIEEKDSSNKRMIDEIRRYGRTLRKAMKTSKEGPPMK